MGRIDPSPPRHGRGPGSPAGWIVAGALAIAMAALVAFQAGKRSGTSASSAIHEPTGPAGSPAPSAQPPASTSAPAVATVDHVSSPSPPEQRLESAVMEVTIARPAAQAAAAPKEEPPPAPPAPETLHETMARCLSFRAEDDEIHSVSRVINTQVRVFVANTCDFSFSGADVWFEVRAIPRSSGGTAAREVGRFFGGPIGARGRAELVLVMDCPACYAPEYRYEASLWSAAGTGRAE